jgi:hypothetical protein
LAATTPPSACRATRDAALPRGTLAEHLPRVAHRETTLPIPALIEDAATEAVVHQLERELSDRGLLLAADGVAAAQADARRWGERLLSSVIERCYPMAQQAQPLTIEFETDEHSARIADALAFGAVTARVVATRERDRDPAPSVELLCAMFNLGIGLIDGVCDENAEAGAALLELIHRQDLAGAAENPRERGWLRGVLPPELAGDHAVAFILEIVETFFAMLHASWPGDWSSEYRRGVGAQLEAALAAERRTVARSPQAGTIEQLIDCSRLTSVIPFEIIETLAAGADAKSAGTGTLLGEAMWRIDDLVDLCPDARTGALNSLLLAAPGEPGRDVVGALERLLASTQIASASREAAQALADGLQPAYGRRVNASDNRPSRLFLSFVQRYAGLAPRAAS